MEHDTNLSRGDLVQVLSANEILDSSGVAPATRAEDLGLDAFARVAGSLLAQGWRP